ncbi:MAG: TRIC cation channel family protein [Nitriliruptoraceae bacterium]|nr:TRIC cation channel family protein [Nitriliruptoraceae bacterium]
MAIDEVLVLLGTVTFAITGALVAIEKRFDIVGVLVLAFVTAIGGGSIRDVIAGNLPPASLTDEVLLWVVFATGVAVFALHRVVPQGRALYTFDTASLAIFAALGAQRGVEVGFGFWGTVFAGAVSGVGGGIIRDVLAGEVPTVLYRSGDFYATAAVVGAAVTFLLLPVDPMLALVAGTSVTAAVRIGSRLAGAQLPVPRTPPGEVPDA